MTKSQTSWRNWPLSDKLKLRDRLREEAIKVGILEAPDSIKVDASGEWKDWLEKHFPTYVRDGFSPRHEKFWNWAWSVSKDSDPEPFVGIWPRGGSKSTSAEMAATVWGVRMARRYIVYVCATQRQADDHIQNIANLLERLGVGRSVNEYGVSRGWKRNRLRTNLGFTVDALGLDVASRGAKLDEFRPDAFIFDDIDDEFDTLKTTEKKVKTITNSILPAGTSNVAVLCIQNLITSTGVFARLAGVAQEPADFLVNRIVSGPEPAMRDIRTQNVQMEGGAIRVEIVGGIPTWQGQDLAACQRFIDKWGWNAFDKEALHNVGDKAGALWNREMLRLTRETANAKTFAKTLDKIVVGVDPPGSTGRCGIVVCGSKTIAGKLHGYTLADCSTEPGASPGEWGAAVVQAALDWEANEVVDEVNQGGAMVTHTIRQVKGGEHLKIVEVRATRGKHTRAEPISTLMEEGREHHVGTHTDLENLMCRWVTGDESPDPLDAKVWALWRLIIEPKAKRSDEDESYSYSTF
ncbi:hypothetical protein IAD21_00581 [Abditibacteriota bacterium]|nr:hypothetical protein IAD21_00581 [Abditibacteriota bacterium]